MKVLKKKNILKNDQPMYFTMALAFQADLGGSDFSKSDLTGASLEGANLDEVNFENVPSATR